MRIGTFSIVLCFYSASNEVFSKMIEQLIFLIFTEWAIGDVLDKGQTVSGEISSVYKYFLVGGTRSLFFP